MPSGSDIEKVTVKLPLVITVVGGLALGALSWWVHANESDIEQVQELATQNAEQIGEVAKAQAVTQTQVSQILEAVKATQQEASQTHDAVIRLEAKESAK